MRRRHRLSCGRCTSYKGYTPNVARPRIRTENCFDILGYILTALELRGQRTKELCLVPALRLVQSLYHDDGCRVANTDDDDEADSGRWRFSFGYVFFFM